MTARTVARSVASTVARPAASVGGGASSGASPSVEAASSSLWWGQAPTLTVSNAGANTLQMQYSEDNVSFSDISGATTSTPTVPRLFIGTYYYRCKLNGGTSYTNTVTITVANPGFAAIYKPQVGDVITTQITDLSGNGNHATRVTSATIATQAAINNQPAYVFSTNARYTLPAGLMRNKRNAYVFTVARPAADSSILYFSTGTVTTNARLNVQMIGSKWRIFGRASDASAIQGFALAAATSLNTWEIIRGSYSFELADSKLFENSELTGSNGGIASADQNSDDTDSLVAAFGGVNAGSFTNGLCAVMAFGSNIELTAQQEADLDAWAAQEYGIALSTNKNDAFAAIGYSSSIDSIPNLRSKLWYRGSDDAMAKPLVVLMHGWTETAGSFDAATGQRWLAAGCNCLMVEMRGRGRAGGTQDGGGREVYDIIDAVRYHIDNPGKPITVDPAKVFMIGYSGGGGNAFSCACRFPDFFGLTAAFFGISDYGWDTSPTTGGWWYTNNASRAAQLTAWIGDRPTYPERYKARSARLGITNYLGRLRMYHDDADAAVPVVNTTAIAALFTGDVTSITTAADATRWLHALPAAGQPVIQAEPTIASEITSGTYNAVPTTASRTYAICGWVETSQFAVWLGDGNSDFGSVTYTAGAKPAFTITSDYAQAISVKWRGLDVGASMTVTINGTDYTSTADADGVATFTP